MSELLPGTEVHARGLRWEVVFARQLGPQTLFRLRGLEGAALGRELDLLHPFEAIEPVIRELRPERAAPLRNWLMCYCACVLPGAVGRTDEDRAGRVHEEVGFVLGCADEWGAAGGGDCVARDRGSGDRDQGAVVKKDGVKYQVRQLGLGI